MVTELSSRMDLGTRMISLLTIVCIHLQTQVFANADLVHWQCDGRGISRNIHCAGLQQLTQNAFKCCLFKYEDTHHSVDCGACPSSDTQYYEEYLSMNLTVEASQPRSQAKEATKYRNKKLIPSKGKHGIEITPAVILVLIVLASAVLSIFLFHLMKRCKKHALKKRKRQLAQQTHAAIFRVRCSEGDQTQETVVTEFSDGVHQEEGLPRHWRPNYSGVSMYADRLEAENDSPPSYDEWIKSEQAIPIVVLCNK